jgi:putative endonuclease
MPNSWYVYIIRCSDNSLYTGITTDVSRRLLEHQSQGNKTAKYLRGKSPLKLVLQLEVADQSAALKIEQKIKRLSKSEKEELIKQSS